MFIGLAFAALATATLSGIAGLGGGTILIGVLLAAGLDPVIAIPLHAVVQLAANGSRTLAYGKHVRWRAAGFYLLGAVPAVFAIAPLLAHVSPDWVRLFMAVFIAFTLWPQWTGVLRLSGDRGLVAAGVLSGGVGSFVGATGPLTAPFLRRPGWSRQAVIATLALCTTLTHGLKAAAFAGYGYTLAGYGWLLLAMVAAVILGTLLGRRLGGYLSEPLFRQLFRLLLVLLAVKLAYTGIDGILRP